MKRRKILLTAFEPFGGEKLNPSLEAIGKASYSGEDDIMKVTLPVEWDGAVRALDGAWSGFMPDAVLPYRTGRRERGNTA